ncbi:putative polysaccharide biosynthesis protein [Metabacillus sp. 84]|uniref:putative polysaccharide biosynthesis protein n=1 Tax=unclassified Metabacillus TaxID=2675274 RepID=UPI003CEA29DD
MAVPSRKSVIWQGAFVLTLAGLLTKIMSAAYRVPYQNIVGDIGFYIYQQVYPLYGISIMLATSGFPVIVSKLFAEYGEGLNPADLRKIWRVSSLFLVFAGLLSFLVLYTGAERIAGMMGDMHLKPLIEIVSFSFLLVPFISVLRGYFQGMHHMFPTALSQVIEQAFRVVTIIGIAYILLKNGSNLYEAGQGALFGSLTGGAAALIVLAVYWFRRDQRELNGPVMPSSIRTMDLIKDLVLFTFTICVSSVLLILIQLVDALQLFSMLTEKGMDPTAAKIAKGIYDRGQPLIQLGTVVATSLSLSLVPLISSAKRRNDEKFIKDKINLSIKVCLAVGAAATAGLIGIVEETNIMLFRNNYGSDILGILSLSILFTSLSMTIAAILQGLNETIYPAVSVIAGVAVKIMLNTALIPRYEADGAAVASVAAFFTVAVLNVMFLRKKQYKLYEYGSVLKIALASLLMFAVLKGYMAGFEWAFGRNRTLASIEALTAVAVGGAIYVIAIIKLRVFNDDELNIVPFGTKIRLWSQKKRDVKK